jgi:hypothetical protein
MAETEVGVHLQKANETYMHGLTEIQDLLGWSKISETPEVI